MKRLNHGLGRRVWVASLVVAAGLLGPLVSRCQALELSPEQKQEMRQHYDRASRAYDIGKFSEAIDEYQKVYEIGGNSAMLYNIAQSYRLSNQIPEALRFYRRYLERAPEAANRDDVERKIADLEKSLDERRRAAGSASSSSSSLSPAPAGTPGAAATAAPPAKGPGAAGAPPTMAPPPFTAAGPPAVVAVPAAAPAAPPVEEVSVGGVQPLRWVAYSLMAVGVGGLILAAVDGTIAADKADKLSAASKQGLAFDPAVEANGKRANTIAVISGAAGVAALVAGGILLFTRGVIDDAPASTAPGSPGAPGAAPMVAPVMGSGFVGAEAAWSY
jgi:tetratricopeptide (TPR) repeat protein